MKTREQILADNPLETVLRSKGVELVGRHPKLRANRCPVKPHSRGDTVAVDTEKGLFNCFACGCSGTVIDWLAIEQGKSVGDVLKELGGTPPLEKHRPHLGKLMATYYYRDANGSPVYKVCRYEPKTFRPYHRSVDGKQVDGLEGVTRVLYNLPELLDAEVVAIVEGEKDADNLNALDIGLVATTNCSGAESWLDSYADSLANKQVVIIPDQDEKGNKHASKVIASLQGKAKTIRRVDIPKPHKDVSDYIVSVGADKAREELAGWIASAKVIRPGHDLPFKDMAELEQDYRQHVKLLNERSVDLSGWLPELKNLRKLVPGDMVAFLADTGSGKTAFLVNLIKNAHPIPTLSFELELGEAMTFERFAQSATGMTGLDVERSYSNGSTVNWRGAGNLGHFLHCTETRLTPERIEELIEKAELRLSTRPVLVTVDYIGLMSDTGGDRYERLSNIAEKLRMIARRTQTIMVVASQVKRRVDADNTTPVSLHDAKNSGSIENSASLVLGAWRDEQNPFALNIRVLKASRGGAGDLAVVKFVGNTMQIESQQNGYSENN